MMRSMMHRAMMHSMMRSWLNAGTSPDLFDSSHWGWSLDEHPCYENLTRANPKVWYGINCSTMSYQPEGNLYSLVQLNLDIGDYGSKRLAGELPPAITNLTNLEYLWIENARKLSGPLPAGLFCFSKGLQYIKILDCSFSGSISSGFGPNCGDKYGLQYFNLDLNDISSIVQSFTNINVSSSMIQTISMKKNKFQLFPKELLQLPNLVEITLDSNNITGELWMPNISCQNSKIKSISLLYNNITYFYSSSNPTSSFSESSILLDTKIFLYGNPICTKKSHKSKLLRSICRINATFPIEDEEVNNDKMSYKILLIIVPCVSIVAVVIFIMFFFVIQKLKKKISLLHEIQSEFDKRDVKPNLYSFSELRAATEDFHIRNELGRGGFGIVYKGVFPDGSHVAVKRLTKLSMEQGIQDFLSEIIVVSNIKHHNLVQLKGCCIRDNQRILVHEFVENKNLEDALWRDSKSNKHLDWPTRFNIIFRIARGLAYLHEDVQPAIVHRDIKGENILLDKHYNPKIADFGLALFFPSLDDGETHMSVSKVAGTRVDIILNSYNQVLCSSIIVHCIVEGMKEDLLLTSSFLTLYRGYMAPEHMCYRQVSTKLDVFSFGVLLLEIVSGRKMIDLKLPSTKQYLVQWAQELHSNDNLPNLKDKSFEELSMVEEVAFKQVVKVGLQCLHHFAARRPSMSEVVAMLIGNKNVDDGPLEDYYEGPSSLYIGRSSNFCFSTPSSSLQCMAKDDESWHLNSENHKQSLQLSEIRLLSK